MIIQPGANSPSTLDMVTLVRTNSLRQVDVQFQDDSGVLTDIDETFTLAGDPKGELDLEITTIDGSSVYSEIYFPHPGIGAKRITHPTTGKYQIKFGTQGTETFYSGGLLFNWHLRQNETSDDVYRTQLVEVVSPRTLSLLPRFRLALDKSLKVIVPEQWCTLGYSDAQLIVYLQMGLSRINSAQPYVGWASLDQFPTGGYFEILIRCALLSALDSQYLFAVDTDVPAFADQGHSFTLSHAAQIKAMRDGLAAELERDIREFKLHFVRNGSLGAEFRIGWAFYQMISAAPAGSIFRNTIALRP